MLTCLPSADGRDPMHATGVLVALAMHGASAIRCKAEAGETIIDIVSANGASAIRCKGCLEAQQRREVLAEHSSTSHPSSTLVPLPGLVLTPLHPCAAVSNP